MVQEFYWNLKKSWQVNEYETLEPVFNKLRELKDTFDQVSKKVSMADLIVLAGNAGIEMSMKENGLDYDIAFTPGRNDTTQALTDVDSFKVLEPKADGFRNYCQPSLSKYAVDMLIDKAQLLNLTAPQMTVLYGGLRALNINYGNSPMGLLTDKPGVFSNDYFVNLLDMNTKWQLLDDEKTHFEGLDRKSNERKWLASQVDLVFGSNSQLRSFCEVYASDDNYDKFIKDFIFAWNKVMNSDLF